MAKIPEAQKRLFKNVFVCKKCHAKIRADHQKILKGKIKCRKCNKKAFRPLRKKQV
jgi:ribosomal protein L40E